MKGIIAIQLTFGGTAIRGGANPGEHRHLGSTVRRGCLRQLGDCGQSTPEHRRVARTMDRADLSALGITADSTVTLHGNQSINALIFGDSDTNTAAGWILSSGSLSSATLTLSGTTPRITVEALGGASATIISAGLAGTAGLTGAGASPLILTGANAYGGGTTGQTAH